MTTAVDKYKGQYIEMANSIIQAKEKTSLLESKIEVLAVRRMATNLKTRDKVDSEGNRYSVDYVELRASEIRALTDRSGGSLYDDIFNVSMSLKKKFHIMKDRGSNKYTIRSLYGDISYENGVMEIEYNPETEYLFKDLKANYTRLSLPILFSFRTNGGFQLYMLLKSMAFNLPPVNRSKSQEEQEKYPVTYSLAELRMNMGFVDLEQKDIKREAERKHPDFEKMADMELKPKYKRWSDFNTRVIKPGLEEINGTSDIYICDIATDSTGKGSKVTEVTFYIQHNLSFYEKGEGDSVEPDSNVIVAEDGTEVLTPKEQAEENSRKRVMEILGDGASITERDADILLKDAGGDLLRIEKAYRLSLEQEHIANFMGWMRAAIRGDYQENVEMSRGSSAEAKAVRNLQEEANHQSTQERVWKRTQEKEDFGDFLLELGYSLENLELIYDSPKEKVQLYLDWKISKMRGE